MNDFFLEAEIIPPPKPVAVPRPTIKMRDYQARGIEATLEMFKEKQSALVVMPTGCGKTILFAEIIRRFAPGKAIVLAHREELIFQAQAKISDVTGFTVGIEMADLYADINGKPCDHPDVVVSTIQTQCSGRNGGRMLRFDPHRFALVIIDEAHHGTSGTYKKVMAHFKQNPRIKILGVTATPDRADEEALGQVYDDIAFDYEILDAIRDGWLVPIEQQMVEVEGLDFSACKTTAGDLNGADLAAVMEYEKNLHAIADPTIHIAGKRRTLVFAASVAHAERLCEIFNRHRNGCAEWICGKTEKGKRRGILSNFAAGRTQFLVNVGCLTEGFDDPGVEVIAMARPTKSRSLYAQMAGRATRPLPGVVDGHERDEPAQRLESIAASAKPHCLIVDFVGNSGRHKLMTTADILGGNVSEEVSERAAKEVRESGKAANMVDALAKADSVIKAEAEAEARKRAEELKRERLKAKATYTTRKINPFDVFGLTPQRTRPFDRGRALSEKQCNILLKMGLDPAEMEYGAAKQILDAQFARWAKKLCTFKQAVLLKKHGFNAEVGMAEASAIIDRIAKSGWKLRGESTPAVPPPAPPPSTDNIPMDFPDDFSDPNPVA